MSVIYIFDGYDQVFKAVTQSLVSLLDTIFLRFILSHILFNGKPSEVLQYFKLFQKGE